MLRVFDQVKQYFQKSLTVPAPATVEPPTRAPWPTSSASPGTTDDEIVLFAWGDFQITSMSRGAAARFLYQRRVRVHYQPVLVELPGQATYEEP